MCLHLAVQFPPVASEIRLQNTLGGDCYHRCSTYVVVKIVVVVVIDTVIVIAIVAVVEVIVVAEVVWVVVGGKDEEKGPIAGL